MTDKLPNSKRLLDLIKSKNISVEFLSSAICNQHYFTDDFHYDNIFWKFNCIYDNFFELLRCSKKELCELRSVGDITIDKLNDFLSIYNCEVGMFEGFSISNFNSIIEEKTSLEDLTEGEKSISLVFINCLVKSTPNDADLGKQLRSIFNTIK